MTESGLSWTGHLGPACHSGVSALPPPAPDAAGNGITEAPAGFRGLPSWSDPRSVHLGVGTFAAGGPEGSRPPSAYTNAIAETDRRTSMVPPVPRGFRSSPPAGAGPGVRHCGSRAGPRRRPRSPVAGAAAPRLPHPGRRRRCRTGPPRTEVPPSVWRRSRGFLPGPYGLPDLQAVRAGPSRRPRERNHSTPGSPGGCAARSGTPTAPTGSSARPGRR